MHRSQYDHSDAKTNCLPVLLDLCQFLKSADIEDITFKTGNFKKFPVFVEMLESAIAQVNDVWHNLMLSHRCVIQCLFNFSVY